MKKFILIFVGITTLVAAILLSPLSFEIEEQQWIFYDANDEILFSEIPHFQTYSRNERFEKYLIAVEDKHFRSHFGVDFGALTRAAFQNVKQDKITSGASTITMQLARLLFLENETHDWKYKLKQIFYALKLEAQFSKDEILKMYLDRVYFGNNATGINTAANAYFGKPTTTLSTAQMATLIGIIPRPDTWNPIANPEIAQERREQVLVILKDKELITDEDLELYKKQNIHTKNISPKEFRAPHFVLWAKQELQEEMKNQHGKIHVRTTLDGKTYTKVLNLIRKNIENSRLKNISNMSVVSLRQPENSLEIMLGSQDFFDKELNGEVNMTTSSRETGSTLKPFLFSLSLDKGMSPLSGINDTRQSFLTDSGSYSPRNFEPTREHGTVGFREALTNSYNIAAVDLLNKVGTSNFQRLLSDIGIIPETSDKNDLSVILGTGESSLLQLTNAYAIFPHRGVKKDVQFFTQVNSDNGNLVLTWDEFKSPEEEIFQESTSDWITHALSDKSARWINFSQGNPLELPFETAAKTGTSQDFRDNYVIGFSSKKTVGVWAGNTDGTPMNTSSGIEGAGETWHTVMQIVHNKTPQDFTYNSNRKEQSVCTRPYESFPNCAEQHIDFLLPNEEVLNDDFTQTFSISYPGDGDIFHVDSPILIDVRKIPSGETIRYFLDGEEVKKLIDFKIPSGRHTISAETESVIDTIQISIE